MKISSETVVLVTGASSGLGRAIALELARRGARLSLLARRRDRLSDVAAEVDERGGAALAIECDVTDRAAFEAAVADTVTHFGHLDVLINNAGRGQFAYVEDTPDDQLESIFRLNVYALWYGTSAALRHMRERNSGHIINIASMGGKIGFPANAAYVAAKHATVGFTRALRSELTGTGIDATVVVPGGIITEWAEVTEGGPMLELFEYERRRGAEIAAEQGVTPPAIPVLGADEVATTIVDMIEHPAAELFTHPGTKELAEEYQSDQTDVERKLQPLWLANREGYVKDGRA